MSIRDSTGPPKPPVKTSSFFLVFISVLLSSCGIAPPPTLTVPLGNPTATPLIVPRKDGGDIVVNVQGRDGQVLTEGVVVRVSSTYQADDFDENEFRVGPCDPGQAIVAWAPGFRSNSAYCDGNNKFYSITLEPLVPKDNNLLNDPVDNPFYVWQPAGNQDSPSQNCVGCHNGQRSTSLLEYQEWQKSGHASVFSDRFFETIYLGTNLNNNKSLKTNWSLLDDRLVKDAPKINNYFGPGYKLDFPYQYGNCAYCHAPAAVGPAMTEVDLEPHFSSSGGVVREGVTCDICHKVLSVNLDDRGYPYANRPGILSFQFLRPLDASNFFVGPLINYTTPNTPNHTGTCSPIFSESAFCAACHYGKFYDSVIYGSYAEWRNSEYGRVGSPSYRTCQDCHMKPADQPVTGDPRERQICSIFNIENRDYSHNVMDFGRDKDTGREIPQMIKRAAIVDANIEYNLGKRNWLTVNASVEPVEVGHRFPTDSPLRHLILVIEVMDERDTLLDQVDGGIIPSWAGVGSALPGTIPVQPYGGLPGTIFANLLMEEDTNISPTTAYWNETRLAWIGDLQANPRDHSDTRLYPDEPSISSYSFEVPDRGDIKVNIKLIYRFAFFDLMLQKGWYRPDIEVASKNIYCKRSQDRMTFTCN